jgi:hypothetical protein
MSVIRDLKNTNISPQHVHYGIFTLRDYPPFLKVIEPSIHF